MARRPLGPEDLPPGSLVEHETFYYHDPEDPETIQGGGFGASVTELGEVLECRRSTNGGMAGWYVEVDRGPVKNGRGGRGAWAISDVRKIDVVDALASLAPKRGPRSGGRRAECRCGCGTEITEFDSQGRPRDYLRGHNRNGCGKEVVLPRRSHERAVAIKRETIRCEWELIGGCGGPLDVAHVDGDELNNEPENLKKLCRSHHRLLDRGRIDPKAPKMPAFYVGSDGKRRYEKTRKRGRG